MRYKLPHLQIYKNYANICTRLYQRNCVDSLFQRIPIMFDVFDKVILYYFHCYRGARFRICQGVVVVLKDIAACGGYGMELVILEVGKFTA